MDTRLVVIISSLAVLSSATTSTDTITSTVPGNGGGSVPAISSISQTALNQSSLPSTSTTSHTANPSPSPQVSTNLTLAPTISISMPDKTSNASQLNNPTNHTISTTTTHSSNITSSSVLEENTTQDPSGTTEPPVNDPHTTIEPSTSKYICIYRKEKI
ncbi:unnamed protein product [Mytilus edulis]|uniref:Uncharacterized protein n=1 Tax=Mytilus edulis TaxID=6550 RepID=A0A8S3UDV2_MYTED|nr:unnamed protein product [Mytilus edulis]